jgi:hypothetical protein
VPADPDWAGTGEKRHESGLFSRPDCSLQPIQIKKMASRRAEERRKRGAFLTRIALLLG